MDSIPGKVITDVELRARLAHSSEKTLYVAQGTILTPAAKDFIKENGITLCSRADAGYEKMTTTQIPKRGGKAQFVDAATGEELTEKSEEMTHLRGNLLVAKSHPRIAFRGRLDSLMAQIMGVQMVAAEEHCQQIADDLEQLLSYVRKILAAEVKEEALPEVELLQMDSARIRHVSHHVKEEIGIDHPVPNYRMGRLCIALNRLRTQVREVELAAVRAFEDEEGNCQRKDIVEGLNRLSSCVYILFCRKLAGYYEQERTR